MIYANGDETFFRSVTLPGFVVKAVKDKVAEYAAAGERVSFNEALVSIIAGQEWRYPPNNGRKEFRRK